MFGNRGHKKKNSDAPAVEQANKDDEYTHEMTMVILGCNESGKSTTWRHLQILADESVLLDEKKHFQRVIYSNTITSIIRLMEIAEKNGFKLAEENMDRSGRLSHLSMNLSDFKLPRLPLRLVYDCKCMWEDAAIQQAYQISLKNWEHHTPGRIQYYMDNIFRILSPDFKPIDVDILSAYDRTDAVQITDVIYRKIKINVNCYPAEICDTKNWDTLADPIHALLFVINVNDYDQLVPSEDKSATTNKLHLAIESLSSFLTSKTFQSCTQFYLLLTCFDLFREKTAAVDLKVCFPEYEGGLSPDKAASFIETYFTEKLSFTAKPTHVAPVCVLEKDSLLPVLEELLDLVQPVLPPSSAPASSVTTPSPSPSPSTVPLLSSTSQNGTSSKEKEANSSSSNLTNFLNNNNNNNGQASPVKKEKEKDKKKKGKRMLNIESGFEAVQGRRRDMEDRHVLLDDFLPTFPESLVEEDSIHSYYGVYDGHGGGEAATVAEEILHKHILQDASFAKGDFEAAMQHGFLAADTHILEQPFKSGTTAVVAIVVGNRLVVANVGDSECVIGRVVGSGKKAKTEHAVLSYKHNLSDEGEKQRITAAGGLIFRNRLFGDLAVARALGDRAFKDAGKHFVSAEPYIKQIELTPDDQFLILACDGLWDKLKAEDVVPTVLRLRKDNKTPKEVCAFLAQEALEKGSGDNITVVIAYFNWKK